MTWIIAYLGVAWAALSAFVGGAAAMLHRWVREEA